MSGPTTPAARRAALVDVALADIARGLTPAWPSARLLARGLARPAARAFVDQALSMDARIASRGLAAAADLLLAVLSGPATLEGLERVPATGPLVVVANHPGTVDAPLLWRALAVRSDLRIIALDRPFLRALPALSGRLLFVGGPVGVRTDLVRLAAAHLREGGALLTFPAGTTEPDPALRPDDASASLARWSRSPGMIAGLAKAPVLPVAVSGVISREALGHPLVRVRSERDARELAAATWQVVTHDRSITPRLAVGTPLLPGPDLRARIADAMAGLLGQVGC